MFDIYHLSNDGLNVFLKERKYKFTTKEMAALQLQL